MININDIKKYFDCDMVFVTEHAAERFRQRGIRMKDIRSAVLTGKIIEQYSDDYPFPSCLIIGAVGDGKKLHVVMSDEGTSSRVITAYYPNPELWDDNLEVRKEH